MHTFWVALAFTFLAEMGDKTQFVALLYTTRYGYRQTILGILWAIALLMLASSAAGHLVGVIVPASYLHAASALCFIGFGFWELCSKDTPEGSIQQEGRNQILLIGSAFLAAEIGDKTVFSTLALAATRAWLPVWLGATLGMALSDGLGIGLGHWFGDRLPEKQLRRVAAVAFFGFGLWNSWQAWQALSR